jgi:multiple sugar transport system substrate-binding protein
MESLGNFIITWALAGEQSMVDASRREFFRRAIALAGGGLVAAGLGDFAINGVWETGLGMPTPTTSATSSRSITSQNLTPDYQDFLEWLRGASGKLAGKSLNVSLETEFAPYAIERRDIEFFSYSNISSNYELKPYLLQLSDATLMTRTHAPTYDVFSIDNQNLGSFTPHVLPPSQLAQTYPDLTFPKLDARDFRPFLWNNVAKYPPSSSGTGSNSLSDASLFPFDAPLLVLFYRQDIYSKLGMSPPRTWDEYFDDVKSLKGAGTPYSSATQGAPDVSIVYEFLTHLASFGGSLWSVDGNTLLPAMDSDAAVAALENLVRFAPYADPASHTYSWGDVFTSLARGVSATGLLWHDYFNWLNDPARSTVPGKMALAINPAGPSGSFSTFGGAGLGVSRYSKRPDAAWLWLQWATAKGLQEAMLLDTYHIFPTRSSVFDVPQIANQINATTLRALSVAKQAWDTGTVSLTAFPLWLMALAQLAPHLTNAWEGVETPRGALTAARKQIEQLGTLRF